MRDPVVRSACDVRRHANSTRAQFARALSALFFLCRVLVAILGVAAGSAHATGQYIYDDLGRLVQVTLPNGATIHYQYDANGNVLSINRVNSSAVVISTFAPATGAAGSTVTISGSGFSSTASQNTVRFNGTNATIVSASSTQLRVLVPSGATTGPIAVSTAAGSAASHQSFVVTSMAVASISPAIGLPGTAVTISGSGFSPSLSANQIDFENARASTTSASTTVLRTAVPNAARSGPIRITTPYGSVTSPMDFVIPPAGYQPHDVAVAHRVPVNGNPQSYTFGAANKIGVLLFTGTQGQRMSVVQTGVTLASGSFKIYTPTGTVFYTGTIRNEWVTDLNPLPESGVYSLVLLPGANTGNISIRVVAEVAGMLTPNTSLSASLLPGQNAVYTFEGVAGQGYSFVMSGYTATPAGKWLIATVFNPDGTVLKYCNAYSADGGNCDFTTPASGEYRLRLDPDTTSAASFTMWLSTDLSGSIALNDSAVQFTSSIPGQNRRFTFNAAAGQGITFWYRNGVNAQGILYLLKPDGSVLASTNTFNGAPTRYLDATIPASGTYTAIVFIHGAATANMSVGLVADQTGVLPLNVPAPISLLHGQNATYTFDAGSNRGFSFVVTGFASNPSGDSMTVTVYHPDGSVLKSCHGYGASGGNCDFTTTTTGPHRLRFDPNLTTAVSFNAVLSEDLAGTLTFNAAPAPFTSNVPGQNIRYTFEAAANQAITLLYQDGVNAQGMLYIAKPDGTQLASTNTFNGATSRYLDAVTQVAGMYTAIVFIHGAATANMKVSLTSDAVGTIPINTAFNTSLLAGQNATYSFAAVGGQGFSLVMPGMTTTPANRSLTATVFNPDGSLLKYCHSYGPSGGNCDFVAPTSGAYQLRLDPDTNTALSATIWLSTDLAASITLNDPAVPFVSNIPGQNIRYTFDATAGQNIRFQYTNGVNAQGTLFIFRPDGTVLASTNTFNGATTRYLDATTATSGTYTAVVFIDGAATAQMNVALQTR